jgi:hypothetical protein
VASPRKQLLLTVKRKEASVESGLCGCKAPQGTHLQGYVKGLRAQDWQCL